MQLQKGSIKLIRISTKLGEHGIYRNYNILKSWTRRIDLQLNKVYYWKCDEDANRVWKFARYLTQHYGMFMGKYPRLEGFRLMISCYLQSPNLQQLLYLDLLH